MDWQNLSALIVLVGFIITIGKIVAANTKALTQLQDSINRLDKTLDKQGANIEHIECEVNEHETRITILENKWWEQKRLLKGNALLNDFIPQGGRYMKDKIAKLINVKSIVTLILCAVFAYLSIAKVIGAEQFLTIFTMIISFYFGTQTEKNKEQ